MLAYSTSCTQTIIYFTLPQTNNFNKPLFHKLSTAFLMPERDLIINSLINFI